MKSLGALVGALMFWSLPVFAQNIGAAYVFYTPQAPDFSPHVHWRLASAFSAGLADFLFEVRVLKNLPTDRVDPVVAAEVAQITVLRYLPRLLQDIDRALLAEAKLIHAEKPNEVFKATFEAIVGRDSFACDPGTCGVFSLKSLLDYVIPAQGALGGWVSDGAIKTFIDNLPQGRIYTYAGGAGEARLNEISSLFRRRRYDVTCVAGGDCTGG